MQRFQNVVVAVDVVSDDVDRDGAPTAEVTAALESARWVAGQSGGALTLMAVVPDSHPAEEREELVALARQRLQQRISPLLADVGEVGVHVDVGRPVVCIVQQVLRAGHDLVIVGARKASTVHRAIVGGVAKDVLRKCPCPVLVAPRQHVEGPHVVLAAVGRQELTPAILELAATIAAANGAAFNVFHCPEYPAEGGMRLRGASVEQTEAYEAEERHAAWKWLHELCDPLGQRHGVAAKLWMAEGRPGEQILATAQQLEADLIVMGTIGRQGLPALLVGNTAEAVFSSAECSLLAIKPEGFVSPITL